MPLNPLLWLCRHRAYNEHVRYLNSFLIVFLLVLSPASAQSDDSHLDSHTEMDHGMMSAFYGEYIHTREASGTAWQPDSTPMEGWHFSAGDWSLMAHGFAFGTYDNQGGKRGDEKTFSTNMGMLMGTRELGPGTIGFRSMLSLEPLMGNRGYPELMQTGETADGKSQLIDRQHPHDLFMEMALTYSVPLTDDSSVFIYGGLPGEPAIGPPAFMHRWSGEEIPEAPITHHWLDSSHITWGVVTLGYILSDVKLESSIFNGREPDEDRWNYETRALNSYSFRASYNPTENWSGQVSYAYFDSPEQLSPQINQNRVTASAIYNLPFGEDNNWATTLAWGRDMNDPGHSLNAFMLESTVQFYETHTFFGRFENVQKDELFPEGTPNADQVYRLNKIALGYIYDFPPLCAHLTLGLGGEAALAIVPGSLDYTYGDNPFSYLLFLRGKIV